MKIPNRNPQYIDYEIFPHVAELDKPCTFTARGCGIEAALTPGGKYTLFVIGQEENNSSILLRISDWAAYDSIPVTADKDGCIRFTYTFRREQIYTLRLGKQNEKGDWVPVANFRIFAAAKDLYERTPLRGNTHCHACPSVDGHEDPYLAAAMYRKAGFDFLAITDHHLIDGSVLAKEAAKKIPTEIALYYGEEVHVPNAYIHAVNVGAVMEGGVGINTYYNAHEAEINAEVQKIADGAKNLPAGVLPLDFAWRKWIADTIHKQGGIAILAHPFWEWDAHNTRDDVFRYFAKERIYDAAEILHGQEPHCTDANLQLAFWNDMRADGIYISPLGADDAHRRNFSWNYESSFNEAWSVIFAKDDSFDGFAEALKSGYTAAVEGYEGAPEHVIATYRLTKYCVFLLEQYFPLHDEFCFEQGCRMRDAYLGEEEAIKTLHLLSGRVRAFTDRFFGR